jgi:hypothetical protein
MALKKIILIILLVPINSNIFCQIIYFNYDTNKNLLSKDKTGLSNSLVQNNQDDGTGSLRDIITDACPEDTIRFVSSLVGDTIKLTGNEIVIDRKIYIQGLGMDDLTISGENTDRIFNIRSKADSGIEGVKLINGFKPADGGAIINESDLLLKDVIFQNNKEGTTPKALTNKKHLVVEGTVIIKD